MKNSFISILENLQNLKFDSYISEIIEMSNKLEARFNDTNFAMDIEKKITKAKGNQHKK